jgi:hypothetical protein
MSPLAISSALICFVLFLCNSAVATNYDVYSHYTNSNGWTSVAFTPSTLSILVGDTITFQVDNGTLSANMVNELNFLVAVQNPSVNLKDGKLGWTRRNGIFLFMILNSSKFC